MPPLFYGLTQFVEVQLIMWCCRSIPYPFHQVLDSKSPLGIDRSFYTDVKDDIPWLVNANMAIKRAQEDARAEKLIRSSLQSSVVLILPEADKVIFNKYINDLASIFVVSSVALEGEPKGDWLFSAEFDAPSGKGMTWVLPPKDAKCPRCWRYVAPAEDELCTRCEDIVGLKEDRVGK